MDPLSPAPPLENTRTQPARLLRVDCMRVGRGGRGERDAHTRLPFFRSMPRFLSFVGCHRQLSAIALLRSGGVITPTPRTAIAQETFFVFCRRPPSKGPDQSLVRAQSHTRIRILIFGSAMPLHSLRIGQGENIGVPESVIWRPPLGSLCGCGRGKRTRDESLERPRFPRKGRDPDGLAVITRSSHTFLYPT